MMSAWTHSNLGWFVGLARSLRARGNDPLRCTITVDEPGRLIRLTFR